MCKRTFAHVFLLVVLLTRLTNELHPEENPEDKRVATKIRKRESSAESEVKSNDNSTRSLDDWMTKKGSVRDDLMAVQAVVVKDEQAAGCEIGNQKSHNIKAPFAVVVGLLSKNIQVIRVVDSKAHPFHQTDPNSPEHTKHDIAILKLACRIKEDNLQKIELPKAPLAELCSYQNCRVALIRKTGQTSIQIQEIPAANIPLSRRRRATQDKGFEPNDNSFKSMPIDPDEQRSGRTLKLAEPPIFTSKIINSRTNESTSKMVNYQSNRSKVIQKDNAKSARDNTSTASMFEEQESIKDSDRAPFPKSALDHLKIFSRSANVHLNELGTTVPVAKDNEVQANITRPKDIQDRREVENVPGNIEVEKSSRKSVESKGNAKMSKTNDLRRSTNTNRLQDESTRSFVARSSDGTRGCPQTGSPTMFEKVQAGLVAVSCDDRQPTEKWRYTDLFENADWIEGTLKNWNYDPTNRYEKNDKQQDGRCSTCIFNFFINYSNNYNNYREPASSYEQSTMIVNTSSSPTIKTTSNATSRCLPEQGNAARTMTINEKTIGPRCKVTKVLVKATVIAQDVPIGSSSKVNSTENIKQLFDGRRKMYRSMTRPLWYSYQPMIPATLTQKKRPRLGQRYSDKSNSQVNRSYGKYLDESRYIPRPSGEQTMSDWRTRVAGHRTIGTKHPNNGGQRFNVERSSPDEYRRNGARNSRKTRKQNEDPSKIDTGTIARTRISGTEEPDESDRESRGSLSESKGLLKSLIAEWSKLPVVLSNGGSYEADWSEQTAEQSSDGTNDNWRTIALIPARSRNVNVGLSSGHNATDRHSIYRKFGAIPMDSANPDVRAKVIGTSFDDEGLFRDPRVNVEKFDSDEMVSSKNDRSSTREDVEDLEKHEVPFEGSLTSNGDQIGPRSTGTGVPVAEESSRDVGELQKSAGRIEGSKRTGVECSNDYVDSIRAFFGNGTDVRRAGQQHRFWKYAADLGIAKSNDRYEGTLYNDTSAFGSRGNVDPGRQYRTTDPQKL